MTENTHSDAIVDAIEFHHNYLSVTVYSRACYSAAEWVFEEHGGRYQRKASGCYQRGSDNSVNWLRAHNWTVWVRGQWLALSLLTWSLIRLCTKCEQPIWISVLRALIILRSTSLLGFHWPVRTGLGPLFSEPELICHLMKYWGMYNERGTVSSR